MGGINTIILNGVEGKVVEVQTSLTLGLNRFVIVGLPDRAIAEAKERIMSALVYSKIEYPYGNLVVNLSPAFLEKAGTGMDLPICLGVLLASGKVVRPKLDLKKCVVVGELGLDGTVSHLRAAPAVVLAAKEMGFSSIVLPQASFKETQYIDGIVQHPVSDLKELLDLLRTGKSRYSYQRSLFVREKLGNPTNDMADLRFLVNREQELKVLSVAAAGGHNMLLDGSPGSGKTSLLMRYPLLLPPLEEDQALEVFKLHSLLGDISYEASFTPPFRSPHHTISSVALVGGGASIPVPGEISLAHNGVLFLDEINEFEKHSLESLRQPMVEKQINISRANYKASFPSSFQLVASRNPCPCGWYKDLKKRCTCTDHQVIMYQNRVSGALLDRIDIKYRVENILDKGSLSITESQISKRYSDIVQNIGQARERQKYRYRMLRNNDLRIYTNADLENHGDQKILSYSREAKSLLKKMINSKLYSLRTISKISRLARTVADLEDQEKVSDMHLNEGFQLNSY